MDISNALTPVRGDVRYVRKVFSLMDMFDNSTSYIELGEIAVYERFNIEYVIQLPISGRSHHGMISITVLGPVTAEVTNHEYEHPDSEPEIETLVYAADVTAGVVRLEVTCTSVGENPTFNYRIAAIPAAV